MFFKNAGLDQKTASLGMTVTFIGFAIFLTALGIYDNLAAFGGAGTLVPITGFANAVCAPAIEFKTEGQITGTAAKMFNIAGPVILYGTFASLIYGIVLCLFDIL